MARGGGGGVTTGASEVERGARSKNEHEKSEETLAVFGAEYIHHFKNCATSCSKS